MIWVACVHAVVLVPPRTAALPDVMVLMQKLIQTATPAHTRRTAFLVAKVATHSNSRPRPIYTRPHIHLHPPSHSFTPALTFIHTRPHIASSPTRVLYRHVRLQRFRREWARVLAVSARITTCEALKTQLSSSNGSDVPAVIPQSMTEVITDIEGFALCVLVL